jgi:hypothetical protein
VRLPLLNKACLIRANVADELHRCALRSLVIMLDIIVLIQDWDFPVFTTNTWIRLAGASRSEVFALTCACGPGFNTFTLRCPTKFRIEDAEQDGDNSDVRWHGIQARIDVHCVCSRAQDDGEEDDDDDDEEDAERKAPLMRHSLDWCALGHRPLGSDERPLLHRLYALLNRENWRRWLSVRRAQPQPRGQVLMVHVVAPPRSSRLPASG